MPVPDFARAIATIERLGVSTEVIYYALALGAQDGTTGQYNLGYTPATINMIIIPHAPILTVNSAGTNSQNVAKGYTSTQLFEGDKIEDSGELDYLVTSVIEHTIGDTAVYYECELAMLFPYTQSDAVYPWPAPPTTGGISLNVGASLFEPLTIESILADLVAYDNTEKTCSVGTVLTVDGPRNLVALICSVGSSVNIGVA